MCAMRITEKKQTKQNFLKKGSMVLDDILACSITTTTEVASKQMYNMLQLWCRHRYIVPDLVL